MKKFSVRWDPEARKQLRSIFNLIKDSSPDNAKLVKQEILDTARSLSTMPERYERYEPLKAIPGNFRYKEVKSFLLIYDVTDTEVHIVRLAQKRKFT